MTGMAAFSVQSFGQNPDKTPGKYRDFRLYTFHHWRFILVGFIVQLSKA